MPTFRPNAPVVIRAKLKEVPMLTKVRDTLPLGKLVNCIGTCKLGHTRALPGLFRIMHTHITRTGHAKTPILQMHVYAHTDVSVPYSAQCSDKKGFPQLRIKFGVAKFCPGPTQLCRCLWYIISPTAAARSTSERQNRDWRITFLIISAATN